MLLKWIEETRKKPKAVRDQYAFFGAVVLTCCIVGVWLLSLPTHFASINEQRTEDADMSEGLFSGFVQDIKSQFAASVTARLENEEREQSEEVAASTTKPRIVLDEEEAAALRQQYDALQTPSQRTILIGTTSKDLPEQNSQSGHTNATNTAP